MEDNDTISRKYAIEQVKIAIAETTDKEERRYLLRFIDFLRVLPGTTEEIGSPEYCVPVNGNCPECPYYDFCNDKRFYKNVPDAGLPHYLINEIVKKFSGK